MEQRYVMTKEGKVWAVYSSDGVTRNLLCYPPELVASASTKPLALVRMSSADIAQWGHSVEELESYRANGGLEQHTKLHMVALTEAEIIFLREAAREFMAVTPPNLTEKRLGRWKETKGLYAKDQGTTDTKLTDFLAGIFAAKKVA